MINLKESVGIICRGRSGSLSSGKEVFEEKEKKSKTSKGYFIQDVFG